MRYLLASALIPLSLLLSVGCDGDDSDGGGSPSGPDASSSQPAARAGASRNEQWAAGFCEAMTTFESDIEKLSSSVSFSPSDDAQKIQGALVNFLRGAHERSARLQSDVSSLGDPDGREGAQIEAAMVAALGNTVTVFNRSLTDAQSLATDDADRFESEVAALADSIDAASDDIDKAFERIRRDYEMSALNIALQSRPECRWGPH